MKVKDQLIPANTDDAALLAEALRVLLYYRSVILRRVLALDKDSCPDLYESEWNQMQSYDQLIEELARYGN